MKCSGLAGGALALLIVGLLGCNNQAGDASGGGGTGGTNAVNQAIEAIKEFKIDDVDLKEKFDAISLTINQQVTNIVDAESAKETLPKFNEVITELGDLKKLLAKLPEAARAAFAKVISGPIILLEGQLEVAQDSLEGVKPVVEETFTAVVKALKDLK